MIPLLLLLGVIGIALANGANDNAKGVATLEGSGDLDAGGARTLATLATLLGALTSIFVGARLAAAFSGGGLLPDGAVAGPALLAAIAVGTTLTVGGAAFLGYPISTTHALIGSLVGAGTIATAGQLHYGVLAQRFIAPLLLSPIVAAGLVAGARPALARMGLALGVSSASCVCLDLPAAEPDLRTGATALRIRPVLHTCANRRRGSAVGVTAARAMTGAHIVSAAVQSFARGLNDTPKIAALALGSVSAGALGGPTAAFFLVALAMAIGGWFGSRRVGHTMSRRIARLDPGPAMVANSTTAGLVLAASLFSLPVSMTHVSVGALTGLGWSTKSARWDTIRHIGLSWLLTLPLAAAAAAGTYLLFERIAP